MTKTIVTYNTIKLKEEKAADLVKLAELSITDGSIASNLDKFLKQMGASSLLLYFFARTHYLGVYLIALRSTN